MTLRTKALINKRTKQIYIAISKKKLKAKLKGRLPKHIRYNIEGFDF